MAGRRGRRLGSRTRYPLDRPQEERQDDDHIGQPRAEGEDLRRGGVPEQGMQDLPDDVAAVRLVGQQRAQVEERLRADADDVDLDELVERLGDEAAGDEDEGDPRPAEEDREIEPS